jgi:hypothetical protein
VLADLTDLNTDVTPERLVKWIPDLVSALTKLPKGGGEPEEIEVLKNTAKLLVDFKINMVLRELIVNVRKCPRIQRFVTLIKRTYEQLYRNLGNIRSEYYSESSDIDHIVGRNQFYLEFLTKNENLLQGFLLDSNPV